MLFRQSFGYTPNQRRPHMCPLFPPLVPLTDPQDDVEAMKSYQKEADQGDAVAQFNLGLM